MRFLKGLVVKHFFWLLCGVIFFGFVFFQLHNASATGYGSVYPVSDYDEGVYIETGLLLKAGYHLYSQIYSLQPPLFSVFLASALHLSAASIISARILQLVFGLVLLFSVFGITYFLKGRLAAVVSVFVLAVSPGFLLYSHAVEEEVPMLAFCSLSLLFAVFWQKKRVDIFIFLSGLFLSLALLIKLFAVIVLPSVIILLFWLSTKKNIGRNVLYFFAGLFLPLFISILFFGHIEIQQMFSNRLHSPKVLSDYSFIENIKIIWQFITLDLGLLLLTVFGVIISVKKRSVVAGVILTWFLSTTVLLLFYHPLFYHHPVLLLPPAALISGFAVAELVRTKKYFIPLVILYLIFLPKLSLTDIHLFEQKPDARKVVGQYVAAHTKSTDKFVTGDLWIALFANRLVVPDLADPSYVRISSGLLTDQEAITQTKQNNVKIVVPQARLGSLPGYMQWLEQHYKQTEVCREHSCSVVYYR